MTARVTPALLRWAGTYLLVAMPLHLLWEVLQLPLYTIWSTDSLSAIVFAIFHCTAGDLLIGGLAIGFALAAAGTRGWPRQRFGLVAATAITVGVAYTVYSEWHNTTVTRSWAYADAMPTAYGIGLSPVAQWLIVPGYAFWRLRRRDRSLIAVVKECAPAGLP